MRASRWGLGGDSRSLGFLGFRVSGIFRVLGF